MDWDRAKAIALGIATETAGRAIGWTLWLVGAFFAVSLLVGIVVTATWIGDRV